MNILIVEDHPRVASFIRKGLREEGYQVDVANDGEDGLTQALGGKYDLLILDIMLPRRDGMSVLSELRKRNVATPVLVLSARETTTEKIEALNAGADDYLTKPFSFDELLARVRAIVRRGSTEKTSVLKFADIEMNLITRQVTRGEQPIQLTSKEYSLLEFLLRNPNRVLTRISIQEHVWGLTFDTETNVVDVYVNYLRNKIDRDFDRAVIHTVRGVGYVLKEIPLKNTRNRHSDPAAAGEESPTQKA